MLAFEAQNQGMHRPMNSYPAWMYWLLAAVFLTGALYASANLFGKDYAVQINGVRTVQVTEADLEKAKSALKQDNVDIKHAEFTGKNILVRVPNAEAQLKAKTALVNAFNKDQYSIALNLVSGAPVWLRNIGANTMNLGLDLRGGIEFLMEVDMDSAVKTRKETVVSDIKAELKKNKIRGVLVKQAREGVEVRFRDEDKRDQSYDVLRSQLGRELTFSTLDRGASFIIYAKLSEEQLKETRDYAIRQNISTLRNRVNELGVAEPLIQREGADRIVVQLPGVQDSAKAREILGRAASLQFRKVVESQTDLQRALSGQVAPNMELLRKRDGQPYLLYKDPIVGGESITSATSSRDEDGRPQVNISLDGKGGDKMARFSKKNIGKLMATVYIEYKTEIETVDGKEVKKQRVVSTIINAASISTALGSSFRITGLDSPREAADLALELRSGALIAPIHIVREKLVGPSLGQDNIDKGYKSIQIGFLAVIVFMMVYYKVFGVIASVALVTNLILIVSVMSLLGATLTLPGMAGIVLTVGMAVDANVLIFERIREEIREGTAVQQAIHSGYDKAFSTIADANVTTLIAAIVLLAFGTGPIKGFAVTLAVGILTSMLTAIVGSRALVNLIYGGKPKAALSI